MSSRPSIEEVFAKPLWNPSMFDLSLDSMKK